ncbi:MAG: tRNA (cytidine(34)-2'-O)-methyltransferase [Alphaproteobacteria bacterium]|nr:tRNA (cytidine(34)-2'-O)-methyltransferase [Alphaproteobacteria bacterium]
MQLVAYQPDIAQNLGSLIRLSACMGVPLHIIEPCGFPLDDKRMRRVAMDYFDLAQIIRHTSWGRFLDFRQSQPSSRLLLLSTHASENYTDFAYQDNDILLLGRESAGVPDEVVEASDGRLLIPMQSGARSLNVALAAAMVLGEALRQAQLVIPAKAGIL